MPRPLRWGEDSHLSTRLTSTFLQYKSYFKKRKSPGWCGSVDWVSACEPKNLWFDSQSGHMPGLWARSPVGTRERQPNMDVRETHWSVASRTPPTGDLACNPGMCPDWESNQRPFVSQASTQSTEPGLVFIIFQLALTFSITFYQYFIWSSLNTAWNIPYPVVCWWYPSTNRNRKHP